MATLNTALARLGGRIALCAGLLSSLHCGAPEQGETEIFVAVDAFGAAVEASSVRVQVNQAVVEIPRAEWPLEFLVRQGKLATAEVELRAFGLRDGTLLGTAQTTASFRTRKRIHVALRLDPSIVDVPVPDVNAEVGDHGVVTRPIHSADEDAGLPGVFDAGLGDAELGCEGGACDACTPSPDDCGGCGLRCPEDQQCLGDACKPIPESRCTTHTYGDHEYLLCTDLRNWPNARAACREFGLDLVVVDDPGENAFLYGLLSGVSAVWIGAHDRGDNGSAGCKRSAAEGAWFWPDAASGSEQGRQFCAFASQNAATCTPTGGLYANWRAGEPSNSGCICGPLGLGLGFGCSEGEDCAVMHASDGAWGDQSCTQGESYVCESHD